MKPVTEGELRILVVDDSDPIRTRVCALLGESPRLRVVSEACDGVEAILAFERFRPDAVILDMQLPGIGGLEVLRHIKAVMPECRVVVLTSFPPDTFRQICEAAGADAFYHKASEFERVAEFLLSLAARPSAVSDSQPNL